MLLWVAILSYSTSGVVAIRALLTEMEPSRRSIYVPACIGLLAHSITLISQVVDSGMLQLGLLNALSICVWMTVLVILISGINKPLHNLFPFFMPGSAALLIAGIVTPQMSEPKVYSTGMLLHIFVSLLSYSVMIVATLQAILVNMQSNYLHTHRTEKRFSRILPPLQTMERLMFEWLMVGFVLLTIAIITGGIYVDNMLAQHLIHKTVLTVIAWFFFAILLFGHFYLGWRGQRASRLTYLGFGFLLIAFVGSKFVLEYLLLI